MKLELEPGVKVELETDKIGSKENSPTCTNLFICPIITANDKNYSNLTGKLLI